MKVEVDNINAKEVIRNFYFPKEKKENKNKVKLKNAIITSLTDGKEDPLSTLINRNSKRYCLVQDASENPQKLWMNMVHLNKDGITSLPLTTNHPCWWCRTSFLTCPIGLPVRYVSTNFLSDQQKEYVLNNLKKQNITAKHPIEYFECEGIFCSFPCVKSYIFDNVTLNSRYRKSCNLLTLLFFKLKPNDEEDINIPCAPSWKLLKDWGGHLTKDEFRASIGNLYYVVTENIRRPLLYSCSEYILERRVE